MITIAICTFNRCESLAATLDSLASQSEIDWEGFEVIIVDNNCADETARVVDEYSGRLPLRRVVETEQGLSHARNRAVKEACGNWVLFTDDDVRLDRRWLGAYQMAFERFPEARLACGRILPGWPSSPPAWFTGEKLDLLDGILVWYDLGPGCRLMISSESEPFGASIAIRRDAFSQLGGFRGDLGVCGASVVGSPGTELEFAL